MFVGDENVRPDKEPAAGARDLGVEEGQKRHRARERTDLVGNVGCEDVLKLQCAVGGVKAASVDFRDSLSTRKIASSWGSVRDSMARVAEAPGRKPVQSPCSGVSFITIDKRCPFSGKMCSLVPSGKGSPSRRRCRRR
jgi:hypothetical protein